MKDTTPQSDFIPIVPDDPRGGERVARQARLGLGPEPVPECDAFAEEIRVHFGAMMAGISLVLEGGDMYFIGLSKHADLGEIKESDRVMSRESGYCPIVAIKRQRPLAINTDDDPRYSTNPVAQELGVRSYIGDEVCDADDEVILTCWAVDGKEHDWKRADIDWIQQMARRISSSMIARAQ